MIDAKNKAKELVYLFCFKNPKLDWEEAKEFAKISVDLILKANPSRIDCDQVEFNYAEWIMVKREIEKL